MNPYIPWISHKQSEQPRTGPSLCWREGPHFNLFVRFVRKWKIGRIRQPEGSLTLSTQANVFPVELAPPDCVFPGSMKFCIFCWLRYSRLCYLISLLVGLLSWGLDKSYSRSEAALSWWMVLLAVSSSWSAHVFCPHRTGALWISFGEWSMERSWIS